MHGALLAAHGSGLDGLATITPYRGAVVVLSDTMRY